MPFIVAGALTGSAITAQAQTLPPIRVVTTGAAITAQAQTLPPIHIVTTGAAVTAGVFVPPNLNGLLILKPVLTSIATDCSSVLVVDETGTYNGTTNTWGYNPEDASFDPNRPKRSEVDLYIGWINYTASGQTWTYSPDQSPELIPYQQILTGIPVGGNAIYLIAVPSGTVLTDYQKETLPYIYQSTDNWYGGQCPGIGIWCAASSKMVELRRIYNDATINGGCEYEPFLIALSMEKTVVSLMQAFEYVRAVAAYDEWIKYLDTLTGDCENCV